MIVLGVVPGMASLAYCVLSFRDGTRAAHVIDADLLKGSRPAEDASIWTLAKSARVHALIMGVVFDRDPPAVLAVGPPGLGNEPALHVEAVVRAMTLLAMGVGAKVVTFPVEEDVHESLRDMYGEEMSVGSRSLRRAVQCSLVGRVPPGDRRLLLAAATGIAGAHRVRTEVGGAR